MFFALGIAAASFLVPARFSNPCRCCQKNIAESLTIYIHGNGNAVLIIKQLKGIDQSLSFVICHAFDEIECSTFFKVKGCQGFTGSSPSAFLDNGFNLLMNWLQRNGRVHSKTRNSPIFKPFTENLFMCSKQCLGYFIHFFDFLFKITLNGFSKGI